MHSRQNYIQALRAFSALSVVYFHSHLAIKNFSKDYVFKLPIISDYGFLGVQVFFVISAFIICLIYDRREFSARDFVIKRFFRIYPLYFAFCVISYVLATIAGVSLGGHDYSISAFLKSIFIIPQSTGPIYAVGWSLEHEIVFYIIACSVFMVGGVNGLLVTYTLIFLASFYWDGWDYRVFSQSRYFLLGLILYKIYDRCGGGFVDRYVEPRVPALLVFLGNISFSLYLVHWFLFPIMSRASHYAKIPDYAVEFWRFFAIFVSVACSSLLYKFFERPFIAFGNSLISRGGGK